MPFELKDIIQMGLGTTQKPKFEIYDSYGAAVTIAAGSQCSFELRNATSGDIILSDTGGTDGLIDINNADTDASGATIKTIQITLNMEHTDITAGRYWLMLYVVLTSGETDRFKAQIDVIDFQEVGTTPVS